MEKNNPLLDLKNNGVCAIKSVFSHEEIDELQKKYYNIYYHVNSKIKKSKRDIYNYYTNYDKEYHYKKNFYNIDKFEVIEINKGRYDISVPYNLEKKDVIDEIISNFIKKNYKSKWGILTSDSKSANGPWHRDTINLDGEADEKGNYDDSNVVHNFNPFYFTILIPLVDMNAKNGSTEFILGSHNLTYEESLGQEHVQFDTKVGDIIIFDGRIFHRGRENNTTDSRPVVYNMIHRDWYVETGD